VRQFAIPLLTLLVLGCHHCVTCRQADRSWSVTRFTSTGAPPVEVGRYRDHLQILPAGHPLAVKAEPLRADVAAHESVLRRLVRERIQLKSPLEFQFMYIGHDSVHNRLVLRYFARAADQSEIAGWQAQLVYSLPCLLPVRAYVQEVPLE
jgi:hypothetical protein